MDRIVNLDRATQAAISRSHAIAREMLDDGHQPQPRAEQIVLVGSILAGFALLVILTVERL